MGPAGYEGGSDLTITRSDCMGCMDVDISAHDTLMTWFRWANSIGVVNCLKITNRGGEWVSESCQSLVQVV